MQEKNAQAYDLTRFETAQFNTLRVVENKNAAQEKRRQALRWVERVVSCALILALTVSVLYSQTRKTALSDEITQLEQTLVEEQSVYDQLSYQLESDATLGNIEEYVSRELGMVKTDKSQVTYVTLTEENRLEVAEAGFAKYWSQMQAKLDELLVYIRG